MSILKTVGLALLSFAVFARQAAAVETCADLITAVEAISGTGAVSIDADFACSTQIEIGTSQDVTITGPATISMEAGFVSDSSSLFVNDGTLTLQYIDFVTLASEGNHAVRNTGTLSVDGCSFTALNGDGVFATFVAQGGAIYSASSGIVEVMNSDFTSNVVTSRGGAIAAAGSETLIIMGSTFQSNEADSNGGDSAAAGGDVWADVDVEVTVTDSVFSGSSTEYGGASIEICGGTISSSNFTNTDSSLTTEHYGAVLVGRPGVGCDRDFVMAECTFSGCKVNQADGAGGSLAIFDTSASVEDCLFESSAGTAVLFQSSDASGSHKFNMRNNEFNLNGDPSELYMTEAGQGSAVVVANTGLEEGDEPVAMGEFYSMFCYLNDPYECEFVTELADIDLIGELKCHVCDTDGVRQFDDATEEDLEGSSRSTDGDTDDSSSDSWDTRDYIIVGLSAALALSVIVGCIVFASRQCKKRTRSSGNSGAGQPPTASGPPATTADPPVTATCPPATTKASDAPAPPAPPATTGTMQPANQP